MATSLLFKKTSKFEADQKAIPNIYSSFLFRCFAEEYGYVFT
jgi:hypothetical protein